LAGLATSGRRRHAHDEHAGVTARKQQTGPCGVGRTSGQRSSESKTHREPIKIDDQATKGERPKMAQKGHETGGLRNLDESRGREARGKKDGGRGVT